jgi:hypothetical protein
MDRSLPSLSRNSNILTPDTIPGGDDEVDEFLLDRSVTAVESSYD